MSAKRTTSRKRPAAGVEVPASFLYRGVRIHWPTKPTKRTRRIYAAALKVMNLGPAAPTTR
jgi:hypothetical protein